LLPKLQEKAEHNVNLLVFSVSDIHHARMIKDYLHYHFQNHVTIDLRSIYQMDHQELSSLSYDIMISNGPLPELPSSLCLCIETLPTPQDVQVIKQKIKEIRLKKLECEV
jgi:transposase-like protein